MSLILDFLVIFIAVSTVYTTFRIGFVRSVLGFIASILSIVISNILSPYAADLFLPLLSKGLVKNETQIPEESLYLFAQAFAFFVVFVAVSIVFRFVVNFISGIFKLPILNSINKILGFVLGCAKALIFVFLFIAILQLASPLLNNAYPELLGHETVQSTFVFKYIYNIKWLNFLVI